MPFDVQGALSAGYTPAQIADEVGKAAGFNTAGARSAGYSDQQIIQELANKSAPGGGSFMSDLSSGFHDLGTAAAQGAHAVGGIMSRNNVPGAGAVNSVGDTLVANTPDAVAGNNPMGNLTSDIKTGSWSAVPMDALHSAVRAAPSALPLIGAGAVGGPLAAAGAAGAMSLGPIAQERAANSGRSAPTTGDVAAALPGAIGSAVGGALIPGSSGLSSAVGRGLFRAGSDAAGSAIMNTAGQLGGSVGTDQGARLSPAEMAAAGLTGGVMGAARSVPEVARAGAKAVTDELTARGLERPGSLEDAASVLRVVNAGDTVRQTMTQTGGEPVPDTAVYNNVKASYTQGLQGLVMSLFANNMIDRSDVTELRGLINNAQRHNNTITDGDLSQVDNYRLPEDTATALKNGLRDLNTASTQSFIKNTTGPLQQAGKFLGSAGSVVGGVLSGNPYEAMLGLMGHGIAGKIGGGIGSIGDRFLGLNTPQVNLQAINARRMLPSAQQPTTSGLPAIEAARIGIPQPGQPDPMTGLPNSPIPPNVPIPATQPAPQPAISPATAGTGLPPLRIDTPADVASTVAADNMASGAPQAPPQAPSPAAAYILGRRPDLGLQHARDAAAAVLGPDAASRMFSSGAPIDPALARQIQAQLPPVAQAAQAAAAIRNPLSYAHNLRQEGQTAQSIVATRPDLAPVVNAMRDPVGNGKTKAGRAAVLERYLATVQDPTKQAEDRAILTPLAGYGQG